MKILNFGKLKKTINSIKEFLFRKQQIVKNKETKIETPKIDSFKKSRRGCKNPSKFKYICRDIKDPWIILYKNFNEQKLKGSLFIIGKNVYRIELNPLY